MHISETLLVLSSLLFFAMLAASICRYLAVPFTVLLVILGLFLNFATPYLPGIFQHVQMSLTSELILFIFLPTLIFQSALSLDARSLLANMVPVVTLAVPGMVISMLLVGLGMIYALKLDVLTALLFGALISATDPVAVVAIFKELGVPRRLMALVEGESLFNDATAIVLFNLILALILIGGGASDFMPTLIFEFFRVFIGGVIVGLVIGLFMSELLVRFYHNDEISIVLSLCLAYFSFIVAEHSFHVSGVMSVLTAAIALNLFGLMRLSSETSRVVYSTWEVLVLIFNSLLFILIGYSIQLDGLLTDWMAILLAAGIVLLARAVTIYILTPLTTRVFSLPSISFGEQHILWWGGLKGGVALAVVLAIPDLLPEKQFITHLTVGVVLITLLVNATSIRYLIRTLKIDRLSNREWAEYQSNLERVKYSVDEILDSFSKMHLLNPEMQDSVEGVIQKDLKSIRLNVTDELRLEQVHLSALNAEMKELNYLYEIGMVNYYTYISFKQVLNRDGERSMFFDSDEMHRNIRYHQAIKKDKQGLFIKLELFIIRWLNQKNWAQEILTHYQEKRFSNRIQHDIAGILMAHEGLKVIKEQESLLGFDRLRSIKEIYQNRLRRRQIRLDHFKKLYPDFYHQYEYFLFQQVSLKYALKLIKDEYDSNKISAKVYHQLQDSLQAGLQQLPHIKLALRLKGPDDWIKNVPLFAGLPPKTLEQLSKNARYVNFLSGDTIFNQNDKGYSLYIVVSGRLNVFKHNDKGESEHIAELREGSFVGEHALLANSRRSATIRAKTFVTLLRLTAREVVELSKQFPELQERLEAADLSQA